MWSMCAWVSQMARSVQARVRARQEHRRLLAGIDDDRLAGPAVGDQVAVLGELPVGQRNDLQLRHRPAPPTARRAAGRLRYFSTAIAAVVASPTAVVTCRVSWDPQVARREQARDRRHHPVVGDDVAAGVVREVSITRPVFGLKPMKTKHPVAGERRPSPVTVSSQPERCSPRSRPTSSSTRVPDRPRSSGSRKPLLDDLRGAELVPPVDHVHLGRVAGEVVGLLDRRVAAAHHRDGLALKKAPSQTAQ